MFRGDPALFIFCSPLRKLCRWVKGGNECYLVDTRTPTSEQDTDEQDTPELGPLKQEFAEVFSPKLCLPPPRQWDYSTTLQ